MEGHLTFPASIPIIMSSRGFLSRVAKVDGPIKEEDSELSMKVDLAFIFLSRSAMEFPNRILRIALEVSSSILSDFRFNLSILRTRPLQTSRLSISILILKLLRISLQTMQIKAMSKLNFTLVATDMVIKFLFKNIRRLILSSGR